MVALDFRRLTGESSVEADCEELDAKIGEATRRNAELEAERDQLEARIAELNSGAPCPVPSLVATTQVPAAGTPAQATAAVVATTTLAAKSPKGIPNTPAPVKRCTACPDPSCRPGELRGIWNGSTADRWEVFPDQGCELMQLIGWGQPGKHAWPPQLMGQSILLIGDWFDRDALESVCHVYEMQMKPYIDGVRSSGSEQRYGYCNLNGVVVGEFTNYGVFPPPYWDSAYAKNNKDSSRKPLKGLGSSKTSAKHIQKHAPKFKAVIGGQDPSLIVVSSYFWDIGRQFQVIGKGKSKKKVLKPSSNFLLAWADKVAEQIRLIRETFPLSRVAWRTAPLLGSGWGGSSRETIVDMNTFGRHVAETENIELVDFGNMLKGESPEREALIQGQKLSARGNEAYVNVLLNTLWREVPPPP